jgi:hypothetical protein
MHCYCADRMSHTFHSCFAYVQCLDDRIGSFKKCHHIAKCIPVMGVSAKLINVHINLLEWLLYFEQRACSARIYAELPFYACVALNLLCNYAGKMHACPRSKAPFSPLFLARESNKTRCKSVRGSNLPRILEDRCPIWERAFLRRFG